MKNKTKVAAALIASLTLSTALALENCWMRVTVTGADTAYYIDNDHNPVLLTNGVPNNLISNSNMIVINQNACKAATVTLDLMKSLSPEGLNDVVIDTKVKNLPATCYRGHFLPFQNFCDVGGISLFIDEIDCSCDE